MDRGEVEHQNARDDRVRLARGRVARVEDPLQEVVLPSDDRSSTAVRGGNISTYGLFVPVAATMLGLKALALFDEGPHEALRLGVRCAHRGKHTAHQPALHA